VVAWHLVHFRAPGRDTIPAQTGITTALFPGLCHPEQRDSAQVGPVLCGILAARILAKAVLERRAAGRTRIGATPRKRRSRVCSWTSSEP
jgi:hypothetical protein